jgi:hypothetical protein
MASHRINASHIPPHAVATTYHEECSKRARAAIHNVVDDIEDDVSVAVVDVVAALPQANKTTSGMEIHVQRKYQKLEVT